MDILFINQYFYPDTASTAQLLTELCISLASKHKITVLCGAPSYNPTKKIKVKGLFEREKHHNISVVRTASTGFSRNNMIGRSLNYLSYLLIASLASLLVEKPDIVVAMTDPPIVGLIGWLVQKRRKVPMVLIVNDLHPDIGVLLGKLRNQWIIKGLDTAVRFILKKASHVVVLGKLMQRKVIAKGVDADKVSIIPSWADIDLITPQLKENPFSLEHGIVNDFTVMYSGNLGLSQNLHSIIDTALLLKDEPNIRFLFIGDGAAKTSLKQSAERHHLRNVSFLPYQPKEVLRYSLSSVDIHIVPLDKRLQGYIVPSKVYGIMAAGRPFIALVGEDSEVAEIVKEFDCGILVEPNNPEALARTILELRGKPQYLEKIGVRGREAVVKHFSREAICKQYQKLFALNVT